MSGARDEAGLLTATAVPVAYNCGMPVRLAERRRGRVDCGGAVGRRSGTGERAPCAGCDGCADCAGRRGISYVGRDAWTRDDELDVRWYFCDAPGLATGLRSNFGAQMEALELGLPRLDVQSCNDPDGAMIGRLGFADRARRIEHALHRLTMAVRDVLFAAYGGITLPAAARVRFGDELGGVILHLAPRLVKLFAGGAKRVEGADHEQTLAQAQQTAAAALDGAQKAYAASRAEQVRT